MTSNNFKIYIIFKCTLYICQKLACVPHKTSWNQFKRNGFTDKSMVKNLSANAGDTSLIPGPGRLYILWSN